MEELILFWDRSRGFTLIEIIVTLVIISVLLTLAATSLSGNRREDLLQEEAKRLYSLMQLAKDEAMLNSRDVGLVLTPDGYGFVYWENMKWRPFTDFSSFRLRALKPGMTLEIEVEGSRLPKQYQDEKNRLAVVFWSTGEVMASKIRVLLDRRSSFQLVTDTAGNIKLEYVAL